MKKKHPVKKLIRESTPYNLTSRELEILRLMVEGFTKKKIGELISLSYHTIDSHTRRIYKKMGVHSKIPAITKAIKENIVK